MVLIYATAADIETWLGETPDADKPIARMLRQASIMVGRACRNDLYDVDSAGKPTDPDLLEAMRDATCAQVEVWLSLGIDPAGGLAAMEPQITSTSVDGGSVSYDAGTSVRAKIRAAEALSPTSYSLLTAVGLAGPEVQ
ncbi:hypothetical protein ACN95_14600 [Gordonia sihwensis]|uniref:hypothetical protein n=1 Tax=Gordonia sihwensis TaxID=173559 RepID=UPI001C92D240|nr:hypothetical protein [Gordonia sihwensis]MBY4571247.1 hypothetical protein [Gordonia sihwensis]